MAKQIQRGTAGRRGRGNLLYPALIKKKRGGQDNVQSLVSGPAASTGFVVGGGSASRGREREKNVLLFNSGNGDIPV